MKITFLTLFPELFPSVLGVSVIGKAVEKGIVELNTVNIRDFGIGNYQKVDDAPAGGGNGMLMRPDVVFDSLQAAINLHPDISPTIILPSPKGKTYNQRDANELSVKKHLIIVCGRYEGIDDRFAEYCKERYDFMEFSIGNYILCGGEVAGMVICESVIRLIPEVLGNEESLTEESFSNSSANNIEHPQYTKPNSWNGIEIPEVLLSGNHKKIDQWKKEKSYALTKKSNT